MIKKYAFQLVIYGPLTNRTQKDRSMLINSMVHLFSSVAHVWVPGAKSTGPIVKKFGFSKI
jgi:hypothetical protein